MTTRPFYDLTPEQWAEVRQAHRRFSVTKDLGRPLVTFGNIYRFLRPERRLVLSYYHGYSEAYDQVEREGALPPQIRALGRLPDLPSAPDRSAPRCGRWGS